MPAITRSQSRQMAKGLLAKRGEDQPAAPSIPKTTLSPERQALFASFTSDTGAIFNTFLRKKLWQLKSLKPISGKKPKMQYVRCGSFSLDQGQTATCYLMSVVTLLQNDRVLPMLLHKAFKNNSVWPKQALLDIIKLLDVNPNIRHAACPLVPSFMRDISENASMKYGDPMFTLMYLVNIFQIYTGYSVNTMFYDGNINMVQNMLGQLGETSGTRMVVINCDRAWFKIREMNKILSYLVRVYGNEGRIRGFIMRVGEHVTTVNVCYPRTGFTLAVCDSTSNTQCESVPAYQQRCAAKGKTMCKGFILLYHNISITRPKRTQKRQSSFWTIPPP